MVEGVEGTDVDDIDIEVLTLTVIKEVVERQFALVKLLALLQSQIDRLSWNTPANEALSEDVHRLLSDLMPQGPLREGRIGSGGGLGKEEADARSVPGSRKT